MKNTNKRIIAIFWTSLALCLAGTATVLAQPVEILVTGGGFTIHGPTALSFAPQPFSFNDQISVVNFKDVTGSSTPYLEISDQNGGSAFSVTLGGEDFTPGGTGICNPASCIPKENIAVRNSDGSSPEITTIDGSSSNVALDPSTGFSNNPPASLDQQRVLMNGSGAAPGTWRIYPQLQETTPGNTAIGNYTGTITITILTT